MNTMYWGGLLYVSFVPGCWWQYDWYAKNVLKRA